jgi:acetoin utilization deacetylase AcuC-like enzyme
VFDVERHHDEVLVLSEAGFDCIHRDGVGRLVLTVSEARELSEKLLEATVVGSFDFLRFLTTPAADPEDG